MAYSGNNLALHEEIALLALEDRKGTFQWTLPGPILGAAIFAELALAERMSIPEDEKDPLIDVLDDEPLGNPILDDALERIASASRRARLSHWISRLGNQRNLQHEVARELCRRGILREDEASVLLFFRRKVYPEVNPIPERALIQRLERAVFDDGRIDDRTAVLVSLAQTSGVLRHAIDASRLKKRKQRLKSITQDSDVGAAAKRIVDATTMMLITTTTITTTS